jgi:hypothetical protein
LFCWQCDVDESGAWQFDDVAIISETVHYHLAGVPLGRVVVLSAKRAAEFLPEPDIR